MSKNATLAIRIISVLVVVGVAAVLGILYLGASSEANAAQRHTQITKIWRGLGIYTAKHDGKYPDSLRVLVDEGILAEDITLTPSGQEYLYEAMGKKVYDPAGLVLLREDPAVFKVGHHVLTNDGYVEFKD